MFFTINYFNSTWNEKFHLKNEVLFRSLSKFWSINFFILHSTWNNKKNRYFKQFKSLYRMFHLILIYWFVPLLLSVIKHVSNKTWIVLRKTYFGAIDFFVKSIENQLPFFQMNHIFFNITVRYSTLFIKF